MNVELGVHLPLVDFRGEGLSLRRLQVAADAARDHDFAAVSANDHLLFQAPWLDGPTALSAVVDRTGQMELAFTVALAAVRGPVPLAKTLSAIDVLSDGRLIAGVGPGSSARDWDAVGQPFEERWKRFDESIRALRSLLREDAEDFTGSFYSTEGIVLEPPPPRPDGPPLWIASWGSPAGLRRVARLGDGWLASGYNTTPAAFRESLALLEDHPLPNGLSTMWLHVTESPREAERVLTDVLSPLLNRPVDALRELALPIGSAEQCAERVGAWAHAGVERIFVWPVEGELGQLELFMERVVPLIRG